MNAATQTTATETAVVEAEAQHWMDTLRAMITRVEKNGKHLYVVVPNIKAFMKNAVADCTKRDNKRRTDEGRFEWLLKTFLRANYDMKGRHMKVHLLQGQADGPFTGTDGKKVKVDLNNLTAETEKEASKKGHAKVEVVKAAAAEVAAPVEAVAEVAQPAMEVPLGKNGRPICGAALKSWMAKHGVAKA